MSRLFGLVASQPVDFSFSMLDAPRQFSAAGQNNPDGWGLGFFAGGRAEVRKHALPVTGHLAPAEGETEATSDLFIAHVRRASRAPRAAGNTHPFAHGGWLFAHTGVLYPLLETKVRRQAGRGEPYEGHTDSEALFRLLLANLARDPEPVEALGATVSFLLEDGQFSGLNFLLARAGTLYAFRYAARSADYFSLFWTRREPGRPLDASSRDNHARLRSHGVAASESVLVCSEELAGETWRPLEMGDLLVIHAGPTLATETLRLIP